MCDKQGYRNPIRKHDAFLVKEREETRNYGGKMETPEIQGSRTILMGSFRPGKLYMDLSAFRIHPVFGGSAPNSRDDFMPMQQDDRNALLAWVLAKHERDSDPV